MSDHQQQLQHHQQNQRNQQNHQQLQLQQLQGQTPQTPPHLINGTDIAAAMAATVNTVPSNNQTTLSPPTTNTTAQLHLMMQNFWSRQLQETVNTTPDFKLHPLPLARIKKVMKADDDVKMISAEAPLIFGKACEIFILELTLRSWMHTEENKRRTLQKSDVAMASSKSDMYDFLIDIVPCDELPKPSAPTAKGLPVPYQQFTAPNFNTDPHQAYMNFPQNINHLYRGQAILDHNDPVHHRGELDPSSAAGSFWPMNMSPRMSHPNHFKPANNDTNDADHSHTGQQ
ncbi:hypothetical protein BASA50_005929 [Batrachochytrium salamandrivorans]|uniref:Core Histone H2A/H2B/H3 domain-containing protein n=1 Tax=Batrachochytrium salamandrivorans TaxID=1357716 RepID=A0ABQ8FBB7_9FUNG|nr:hypothetical protein BASA50_005929 [Batrachochytrium salamandrivorans]